MKIPYTYIGLKLALPRLKTLLFFEYNKYLWQDDKKPLETKRDPGCNS